MKKKLIGFLFVALFILPSFLLAQSEERHEDHEVLRQVLRTVTHSLNSRDVDALGPVLHSKFAITSIDQQVFTDLPAFKNYFNHFFEGEKPVLKSIEFNPRADALTEFIGENVGLSHGISNDKYHFSNSKVKEMTTRWTATVIKEGNAWKLANLHLGVDFANNPLIETTKHSLYWVGGASLLIGLLLGFVVGKQRRS